MKLITSSELLKILKSVFNLLETSCQCTPIQQIQQNANISLGFKDAFIKTVSFVVTRIRKHFEVDFKKDLWKLIFSCCH